MRFLNYAGGVFILLLLALGWPKPEAKAEPCACDPIFSVGWQELSGIKTRISGKNWEKNRVNADIRTFISICECYMAEEEEERMYTLSIRYVFWKPDIILVNDDQATYTFDEMRPSFCKESSGCFLWRQFP
mgnify:CR=1 FL=1